MSDPRLARLEYMCAEQDEHARRLDARRQREVEALKAVNTDDTLETTTQRDRNRLTLLDRIADRCPDLGNVGEHEVEWIELPEGDEALCSIAPGSPKEGAPTSCSTATTCSRLGRWARWGPASSRFTPTVPVSC